MKHTTLNVLYSYAKKQISRAPFGERLLLHRQCGWAGLVKCGSAIAPFADVFPKDTMLYKLMSTRPSENEA